MTDENDSFEINADPYGDEILNANWMPQPEVPLRAVRSAAADETHQHAGAADADAFLSGIYLNQE
ncbi:hypothetical protein [Cognatazoarcus halotolerans]|uniref:hypothetical protein n=1 Tax=Cognatazoarcus halotolerans TaxID=2686016 RepID=UPI0013589F48|nr:hypothetical protein [Cognatazoarcus halotolerans]MBX3680459.1 hypothetical protein [Rhodocyclaceae bacterium]MCB1900015.1 hypothetical protein [Rhodocyclaceae bacterium]MCP5310620.1 hypothetical protein [Zoogloeaceae bacterium]